jgi:hypothetical protein
MNCLIGACAVRWSGVRSVGHLYTPEYPCRRLQIVRRNYRMGPQLGLCDDHENIYFDLTLVMHSKLFMTPLSYQIQAMVTFLHAHGRSTRDDDFPVRSRCLCHSKRVKSVAKVRLYL